MARFPNQIKTPTQRSGPPHAPHLNDAVVAGLGGHKLLQETVGPPLLFVEEGQQPVTREELDGCGLLLGHLLQEARFPEHERGHALLLAPAEVLVDVLLRAVLPLALDDLAGVDVVVVPGLQRPVLVADGVRDVDVGAIARGVLLAEIMEDAKQGVVGLDFRKSGRHWSASLRGDHGSGRQE